MLVQFSAGEVFEIGIEIEKNGKAFYEEAAANTADQTIREFFTELASWEDGHIKLFENMMSQLPEKIRDDSLFDPEDEYRDYMQAAADSHVFIKNRDVSELVAQCGSPFKALEMALNFEKDSVVFYTTIKNAVSAHFGSEKIDSLIEEELKHISLLNDRQKKLEKD